MSKIVYGNNIFPNCTKSLFWNLREKWKCAMALEILMLSTLTYGRYEVETVENKYSDILFDMSIMKLLNLRMIRVFQLT